jgi:hypothetical protein
MNKFCFVCHTIPAFHHEYEKNHEEISGGMEGAGVLNIFNRSLHTWGICYTKYLGDGDSKSYQRVVAGKPYDPDIAVTKWEYTGHVQKRTGKRLRRLIKEKTGSLSCNFLHDSEPLEANCRLTQSAMDSHQEECQQCGGYEESCVGCLSWQVVNKWETPNSGDIWCKFKISASLGVAYEHKHSLPAAVMDAIKQVFRDLPGVDRLKKCFHGKTHNPNEHVNSVI